MSNHEWENMNELDFEALLKDSVSELPPEDIVAEVTPWKKAMHRVLVGMALGAITLNFFCLNYILPAIGMVLSLLGLRTLRNENKWFRNCFIITAIRTTYFFLSLILNTMVIQSAIYTMPLGVILTTANLVLIFIQIFCFWRGLRAVQQKVGLPHRAGGAVALIVWYVLVCLLSSMLYNGLIIACAMVIGYIFIIRSLYKLSKELDEAGYAVQTAPVRVTDRAIVIGIIIVLVIGCACGYLFGNSYPMDWMAADATEHREVSEIKTHLLELGFPEYVLNDLSAEDITACDGASQVVVDVNDHPVNEGRVVTAYQDGSPHLPKEPGFYRTTVYDVNELRITGVAVQIPCEREQWMILQHFLWTTDPGFYGTESIQLLPAYQHSDGWESAGDVTGRVLYDEGGETFVAPYYSLGNHTFTSNSILWGEQTSTDIFAAFSMPRGGENHRGYLAYPITEMQDGWITDCWFNYTHQQSWMQYPVMTAMEKRMTNSWSEAGAFRTIQDALQFYSTDEGAKLLSDRGER